MARVLDKKKFDVTVISPRNHFVFTPLLPSTAVGTIEFRCVQVISIKYPIIHFNVTSSLPLFVVGPFCAPNFQP